MSLFSELKRRNVFRVATAYVVVGWVVLQVADTVVPILGLPEWTTKFLLFTGVCGLPFALVFAWAFELTPEGIKRTEDVDREESITRKTAGKLNHFIIGLLSVAILLMLAERFLLHEEPAPIAATAPVDEPAATSSIAVLPFVNMSPDKANEYFGDGVAEELLNQLARIPDLKVAARTSSFYFRDKDVTIAEVAEALQVETVLEGSVQRSGETIRVTAQLISASDGAHLWSNRYDRPLTDVFAVQDDIAQQIVRALIPHLEVELVSSNDKTLSPDIYERYLLGKHQYYERSEAGINKALLEFEAVTVAAPTFADGWAWLARAALLSTGRSLDDKLAQAQRSLDRALSLDADNEAALIGLSERWLRGGNYKRALEFADRALAASPRSAEVRILRGEVLVYLGRNEEAIDNLMAAREIDPLHPDVLSSLAHLQNLRHQRAAAVNSLRSLYRVSPARAASMEMHLYSDAEAASELVYFGELDRASAKPAIPLEQFAFYLLSLGFYDHPALMTSGFRAVALANLGRPEEARAALKESLANEKDPDKRVFLEAATLNALGDYASLSDMLWQRWQAHDSEDFNDAFWEFHAMTLATAAYNTGERERLYAMLELLRPALDGMSSDHQGNYDLWHARLALLEGKREEALLIYQRTAERGAGGDYNTGRSVLDTFGLHDAPGFTEVSARFAANRNRQLERIRSFREQGLSVEELRSQFFGAGIPD